MVITMISAPRLFPAAGLFLALIMVITMFSAGCLEPYPDSAGPVQPVTTVKAPEEAGAVPAVQTTIPVGRGIDSYVPPAGYTERSYGYVPIETPPGNSLTYIDAAGTKDASGKVTITGRIRNDGPSTINLLHITYTLFDANGNALCNACARIEYLAPGKTWKYTTDPVMAPGYQFFELSRVLMQ
jgi:hypothetical protein